MRVKVLVLSDVVGGRLAVEGEGERKFVSRRK